MQRFTHFCKFWWRKWGEHIKVCYIWYLHNSFYARQVSLKPLLSQCSPLAPCANNACVWKNPQGKENLELNFSINCLYFFLNTHNAMETYLNFPRLNLQLLVQAQTRWWTENSKVLCCSLLSTATQHNFSSVPWKSLAGIRAIRGKYNCALDRSGPEQEQMEEREFGGEWILAAACSGCPSLVTERAKAAGTSLLQAGTSLSWTMQAAGGMAAPGC